MITNELLSIATLGKVIYDQAAQAKANQAQCKRLASRVSTLVTAVQALEKASNPDRYRPALEALLKCLQECEKFVQAHIFTPKTGRFEQFKNFVRARGIKERFMGLSDHLEKARSDLGLAINTKLLVDHDQDSKDAEEDRKKLDGIFLSLASAERTLDDIKTAQASDRALAELKYEHTKERQLATLAQLAELQGLFKGKGPVFSASAPGKAAAPTTPTASLPDTALDSPPAFYGAVPVATRGDIQITPPATEVADVPAFYGPVSSSAEAKALSLTSAPGFVLPVKAINIGFKIPDGKSGNFIGFSTLETDTVGDVRKRLALLRQVLPTQISLKFDGHLLSDDRQLISHIPGFSIEKDNLPGIDDETNRALSAEKTRFECTKVAPLAAPAKHGFLPPPIVSRPSPQPTTSSSTTVVLSP